MTVAATVKYKTWDWLRYRVGRNHIRDVVVTRKTKNIKDNRPGFDAFIVASTSIVDKVLDPVWAYDSQIIDKLVIRDARRTGLDGEAGGTK